MTREDFDFVLAKQYSDTIDRAIVQCESVYRSQIDYAVLDGHIQTILKAAKVDGLSEDIIWNILERKVPGYIRHLNGERRAA